nr:MFS transporter [Burkholderia ubonensis]
MNPDTGLPLPQRYWAIVCVALGITLAVLDGAIANVALPTIAHDLRASDAASIWIVNAYQLAVTISLLPLASLGERIGYRRVYIAGLALFTAASLGCALAGSLPTLAVMRVIQGFGAAGIMSVNAALVRMIYPTSMLGRGLSINAMVVALSSAVGPTVASAVLSVAPWPWLFAINVPIGIAAVLGSLRALPANPLHDAPYDIPSALMNACVFGLLIMAVDGLGHGERSAYVAAELAVALVVGWFFVKRQLSQPAPLLPVDLMRIPLFALSICTSIASFTSQMLAFVALPFWLQHSLGFSQVQTGLYMTPWPLVIVVAAPALRRAVGPLLGRHAGRDRARAVRGGPAVARDDRRASGQRRHRMADGAVRRGLRPVPVAEQPRDPVVGATLARRRRGRHAQHRAADRPDARRRARCADLRDRARARADRRALRRRRVRGRRSRCQHAAHRGAAAERIGLTGPAPAAHHVSSSASSTKRTRAFTLARGSSISR